MYISPQIPMDNSPEKPGNSTDMKLLKEDAWLIDTEVRYHLQEKNSQWHLTMIFISIHNPLNFICRPIDTYPSEKKALTFSKILQRGIRKDARGTQKINKNAFRICDN